MSDKRVQLGAIVGPHGIRGLVRIKTFTEVPEDIAAYGPLEDEAGARRFKIEPTGRAKGVILAKLSGVSDRNAAEALKGVGLYVDRDRLPDVEEDTFYHADLIGLSVLHTDGTPVGRVVAMHDFGAGDLAEVRLEGVRKTVLVPFSAEVTTSVDLEAGEMVIDPPPGLLDEGDGKAGEIEDGEIEERPGPETAE